jgi:hypothetical protein
MKGTGQSVLSLLRTSTPPMTGRAQYPYSLQADKGHSLSHRLVRRRLLNGKVWPGDELGNNIQFSFSCKDSFALSCECFVFHTNAHPNRKETRLSVIFFSFFFITGRQSSGKGCRTKVSSQLLHQAPPFPLPVKWIAWDLGVLTEADSSHRCCGSGPVDTCEGNLKPPRDGDHRAFGDDAGDLPRWFLRFRMD